MARRSSLSGLVLVSLVALASQGCGGPEVGGSGRLLEEAGGAGRRLELSGTAYEQGWWQGHLLQAEIQGLHEAWQRAALALDGSLTSADTKARRQGLLKLLDPLLARLPEALRQELDGLSAGSGLPVRTLLLTEMLSDLLRFTSAEPRLVTGRLGWDGATALWALDPAGPWAALLDERLLWITRLGPVAESRVTVLSFPGSLGGYAALGPGGLALLAVEEALEPGRQSLGGLPFGVALRLAVARGGEPRAALAALAQTTAHRVLAVELSSARAWEQLVALAGEDAGERLPDAAAALGSGVGFSWRDGAAHLVRLAPPAPPGRSRAP